MKKILLSIALFLGFTATAQLPDGSVAPDFTLTDIYGQSHNLYTYLNQGKTVFIDVSATWCGPCWNFHGTGALDDLWRDHGPLGAKGVSSTSTNNVIVLFIEGDAATSSNDLHGNTSGTQGDWVTGVDHPIIDPASSAINSFNSKYAISAFPTIYKICPSRVITEVGQKSAAQLYATVASCPAAASKAVDVANIAYDASTAICSPMNYTPKVKIQNNGLTPLTAAQVVIKQNNQVVSTGSYAGNLTTYGIASVTCSQILAYNGGTLSIEVIAANDEVSTNNISSVVINPSIAVTNEILLTVLTDGYASETSWNIKNSSNTTVAGTTNPTLSNNKTYNLTYTLTNTGCYTFNIADSYGDGIASPGTLNVRDSEGHVITNNASFGTSNTVAFNVVHVKGKPTLTSDKLITNKAIALCDGETLTLTSSSFSGNAWSTGETTKSIIVSTTGNYYVTAQNGNSDTISVTVAPSLSIATGTIVEPTCNGNTDGSIEITGIGTGDLVWNGTTIPAVTLPYIASNLGIGTNTFVLVNGACSSTTITAIINDVTATVPVISYTGNNEFCAGSTLTLSSSESANIVWSTGETTPTINVSTSGQYTVTFTDANGCLANSQVVDVIVNNLPTVSAGLDRGVCIGTKVTLNGSGASTYVWDNTVTDNVAFTFNGTTTYTVVGTDANGCSNTAQLTLTGLTVPVVSAGIDQNVCKGSSITLAGSGASTYVWTNGVVDNTVFTANYTSNYTVIGFAANGCSSSDVMKVTLLPSPTVSFTLPISICKQGAPLTLTATPSGGTFSGSSAISGNVFTPTNLVAGYYTIKYVSPADANGCTGTDSEIIRVVSCAGIEENEVSSDIAIFPNPSNGHFTVTGNDLEKFTSLEILDNTGRVVSKLKVNNSNMNIDLESISNGMYTVIFKGDNGIQTQKIQVIR